MISGGLLSKGHPLGTRESPICARSSLIFAVKRAHGRCRTRGFGLTHVPIHVLEKV
jgi:hypothetical protein